MRLYPILFTVLLCASPALQLDGQTLGQGVADAAKTILSSDTCKYWPPILVKPKDAIKPQDKLTLKDQVKIKGAQDAFVAWLDQTLQVKGDQATIFYADSFLRLFDTPKSDDSVTMFPRGDNSDLMGLSTVPDAKALSIWGTTQIAIKYDCESLGNAYASASPSFSMPLYSIKGGVSLKSDTKHDQTVNFLITTAESPFDMMFYDTSGDSFRWLFASMTAAEWTLRHPSNLYYVKKATLLSVETLSSSDDSTSMLASANFATSFPIVSASADIKTQITRDLQSSAHTFGTYLYSGTPSQIISAKLPDLSALLLQMKRGITPIPPPANPISAGVSQQSVVAEEGWPASLCKKTAWTATATNTLYGVPNLDFLTLPTPNAASYPVCQITVSFQLNDSDATTTALTADPTKLNDPGITLTDPQFPAMTFSLPMGKPLQWAGTTQVRLASRTAGWSKLPVTSPTMLTWVTDATVATPDGTAITGYSIDTGGFKCVVSPGGTSYPIRATFAPATITPDTLNPAVGELSTVNRAFSLIFSVGTLEVSPSYDPDSPSKTQCIITGNVKITTTSSGVIQKRTLALVSSNTIVFPSQLSGTAVSAVVCSDIKKNTGGNYLLASAPASGMSCTLIGSGLQTIAKVMLSSKTSPGSFAAIVTPTVANGGTTATILLDSAAIRSMAEQAYTLLMTDNTAGHNISSLATDINVAPLPVVTVSPASLPITATAIGFTLALQGANLDQIVQLRIKPQNGNSIAATGTFAGTVTTGNAVFPGTTLAPGMYAIFAVVDPTVKAEIDLGKTLSITN
ncbi:hypothetical protein HDF16_000126 [Granulicella aggregans]|uniref:Ig-like domain-containing protein n=1 Tax=Granulicella aggregans TaxID=474949 RepID=A0A7W8E1H8_9BACT|nr:hypothetical protein [Granulicella aggregans]MBB5055457.1 hypothetical protein [Granulicella aggregans]